MLKRSSDFLGSGSGGAALVAVCAVLLLGACDDSPVQEPEAPGASAVGKADTGGIAEGTAEALAILEVANGLDIETLQGIPPLGVGLGDAVSANIVATRLGDDGLEGTADDFTFGSLAQLDMVAFMGPEEFGLMLAYAQYNGFLCPGVTCVDLGITCGVAADGCGDVIDCGSCQGWDTEVVDSNSPRTGSRLSLALTQAGEPRIAFFRHDPSDHGDAVIYAERSGTWNLQIADNHAVSGRGMTLLLDSADQPYIGFIRDEDPQDDASWNQNRWVELSLTTLEGGTWSAERSQMRRETYQASPVEKTVTHLIDDDDRIHRMRTNEGGGSADQVWYDSIPYGSGIQHRVFGNDYYGHLSIDLDDTGVMHVAAYNRLYDALFYANSSDTSPSPHYAAHWEATTIDFELDGRAGMRPVVKVDSDNTPHIAYFVDGGLKFASRRPDGEFSTEVIDPQGTDGCNTMLLDPGDNPHVIYRADTELRYARRSPTGVWQIEVVDPSGGGDGQPACSLAYDSGTLHLAYRRTDPDVVLYATRPL